MLSKIELEGICYIRGVASVMLSKIEREGICNVGDVAFIILSKRGEGYVM